MTQPNRSGTSRLKSILGPLYRGWIWLGDRIGMVMATIILVVFYFVVLSVVSLLLRIFSRDTLLHLRKEAPTFWTPKRDFDTSPERLERSF